MILQLAYRHMLKETIWKTLWITSTLCASTAVDVQHHNLLFLTLVWSENWTVSPEKNKHNRIHLRHMHVVFVWQNWYGHNISRFTTYVHYVSVFTNTVRAVLLMSAHMNVPSLAHAWFMPLTHRVHVCSMWCTGMYASLRCSISRVCYGLQCLPNRGNPCSAQSCHLLSQHDPAWPRGPIVVLQKQWGPINPQLLLGGPNFTAAKQALLLSICISSHLKYDI